VFAIDAIAIADRQTKSGRLRCPLPDHWKPRRYRLSGELVYALAARQIRDLLAECRGQIDLMFLLLTQDLANVLRHGVFLQVFALHHTLPVAPMPPVLVS